MEQRWMSIRFLVLGAGMVLPLVLGCQSEPPTYLVTGAVSYNGTPVAEGDITLVPEDRSVRAEGGKIKDGAYSLQARAGKQRVEIRAARAVKEGPMGPIYEDYIPAEFNAQSKLSADVTPAGKNEFHFHLKG